MYYPSLKEARGMAGNYRTIPVSRELLADEKELAEHNMLADLGRNDLGEVMAVQHTTYPIFGVQFHPESILTPEGKIMLENFIHL